MTAATEADPSPSPRPSPTTPLNLSIGYTFYRATTGNASMRPERLAAPAGIAWALTELNDAALHREASGQCQHFLHRLRTRATGGAGAAGPAPGLGHPL